MESIAQDIRLARRVLVRAPGFTATAVATLALGIGCSVGLFAVVNAALLRPLPFADQERLVLMWERNESRTNPHIEVSLPNYQDWRAQATSFVDMAALGSTTWGEVEVQQDPPVRLTVSAVSASFFDTLGSQAALGRTFLPEEDEPDASRVMVLSHAAWRDYFAMEPAVVGATVRVDADHEPYTIVGVMPPAFQFPTGAQMWTPVGPQLGNTFRRNDMDLGAQRGLGVLYVIGRLAPSRTLREAEAELNVLVPAVWESNLARGGSRRVEITPLPGYIFGDSRLALLSLLGGVAFLLLITVTNVSGLMVVRSHTRRRDLAIHSALGISQARLLRAQLIETLLITTLAAVCGAGLAWIALPVLVSMGPTDLPRLGEAVVDGTALALAGLLALVCGVGMTLVTVSQVRRVPVWEWLRAGLPGATAGFARTRTRNILIVSQVAMTLTLVTTAGLLTNSYRSLVREDLGYRPDGVLTVGVDPRTGAYTDLAQRRQAYQQALARVERLPGVTAVGAVTLLPFQAGVVGVDTRVRLEGEPRDGTAVESRPSPAVQAVSPGYFDAMGIDIVAGRAFTWRDTVGSPGAVVVSESLARSLWPDQNPIGQRLIAIGAELGSAEDPVWQSVVGVVRNARYREIERPRFNVYVPFTQVPMNAGNVVVRTAGSPAAVTNAVRDALQRQDPNLVVRSAVTLSSLVSTVMQPWRFNMTMSSLFAAIALLLSAIGLFGSVAHGVADRTREIGLRRSLGATTGDVFRLVSRHAMILTGMGIAFGLPLSLVANGLLEPLLFGVDRADARILGSVTLLVALVTAAATGLAARRATTVDPLVALRTE